MAGGARRNFIFACRCGNIDMIVMRVSRINTDIAAEEGGAVDD